MRYSVFFYPQSSRDVHRLRMRVHFPDEGKRIAFSLGYQIDPERWDNQTNRCTKNSYHGKNRTSASIINGEIQFYEDTARKLIEAGVKSAEDFKIKFLEKVQPDKKVKNISAKSLIEQFDEYVSEQSVLHGWADATYRTHAIIRRQLIDYSADKTISCDYFDERGMISLFKFYESKEVTNSTIKSYLNIIKAFLNWCIKKGYCDSNKVNPGYRPVLKIIKRKVIFLTWEELMKMYNHKFADDEQIMRIVRDKFCFSCFTGLRYSDANSLNKSDITENYINVAIHKTSKLISIDLNKYSKAIVKRYIKTDGTLLFPKLDIKTMNNHLREIGKMLGFDSEVIIINYYGGKRIEKSKKKYDVLSTHCARRTFICNALSLGIPAEVIMKWTGHSNYSSMRPYIDVADSTKKQAMSLFDQL